LEIYRRMEGREGMWKRKKALGRRHHLWRWMGEWLPAWYV